MSTKIQLNSAGNEQIIYVHGDLTRDLIDILKKKLEEAYNTRVQVINVELSKCNFIDSICLGYLVYFSTYLMSMRKKLVLKNVSEDVELLLEACGLERILEMQ